VPIVGALGGAGPLGRSRGSFSGIGGHLPIHFQHVVRAGQKDTGSAIFGSSASLSWPGRWLSQVL